MCYASAVRVPYSLPAGRDLRRAIAEVQRRNEERLRDPRFRAADDRARGEAAAARLLRERFGATRVRLHGSLARLDCSEDFDIDLAVEGLEPGRLFEAWAAAERLVTRRLDLVEMECATDLMRRRVLEDGIDLP